MALLAQLSGVTKERFNPFRRTSIISWAILCAHIVHVYFTGESLMNEALMYLFLSLLSFSSLAHFIYFGTKELLEILGINLLYMT